MALYALIFAIISLLADIAVVAYVSDAFRADAPDDDAFDDYADDAVGLTEDRSLWVDSHARHGM